MDSFSPSIAVWANQLSAHRRSLSSPHDDHSPSQSAPDLTRDGSQIYSADGLKLFLLDLHQLLGIQATKTIFRPFNYVQSFSSQMVFFSLQNEKKEPKWQLIVLANIGRQTLNKTWKPIVLSSNFNYLPTFPLAKKSHLHFKRTLKLNASRHQNDHKRWQSFLFAKTEMWSQIQISSLFASWCNSINWVNWIYLLSIKKQINSENQVFVWKHSKMKACAFFVSLDFILRILI